VTVARRQWMARLVAVYKDVGFSTKTKRILIDRGIVVHKYHPFFSKAVAVIMQG
jgi:hypothetical protein